MSDDESQPKDRVNDSFSASDAIQDPQDGNEFANDFDEPDLPPLVRYPIHLGPFRYIHFPSRSETSLQTRLDAIFVAVMQLIRSGKKIHASHLANELLPYFSQHPMPIYAVRLHYHSYHQRLYHSWSNRCFLPLADSTARFATQKRCEQVPSCEFL